jgi:zinc/manganese transport system substrate-binding protein
MAYRSSGAALATIALLTLAGCSSGGGGTQAAAPAGDASVEVVTSTNVYGSIAQAVGGERVKVASLINDPAADPHSYESTPADAAKVAGARVVVFNGGGYDDFMPRLVQSGGASPTVIDVAEVSGLVPSDGAAEEHPPGEAAPAEGDAHGHGSFNEHFWYSLPTMQAVASRLAADLGAADPAGAAEYTSNAEAFNSHVADLQTRTQAIGASNPGARVAVTEPVPGYLIQAAGLTDVTPPEFTAAVEEDRDPPAAVLQETLALFQGNPVRALVLNQQTQTPTTDQVQQAAQTAGVPVVGVTETLPQGTTDYVSWMGGQIDALAGALNGS